MKRIPVGKHDHALVDDEDYDDLAQHKWHLTHEGYARRTTGDGPTKENVKMHRQIMNAPKHLTVDHINGDRLDNRRCNLRLATRAENNRNIPAAPGRRFKGVYYHRKSKAWQARIKINDRSVSLGAFPTAEEAARAYDVAALTYHGEFASTNGIVTMENWDRTPPPCRTGSWTLVVVEGSRLYEGVPRLADLLTEPRPEDAGWVHAVASACSDMGLALVGDVTPPRAGGPEAGHA